MNTSFKMRIVMYGDKQYKPVKTFRPTSNKKVITAIEKIEKVIDYTVHCFVGGEVKNSDGTTNYLPGYEYLTVETDSSGQKHLLYRGMREVDIVPRKSIVTLCIYLGDI